MMISFKNHYVIDEVFILYYAVTIFMTHIIPIGVEVSEVIPKKCKIFKSIKNFKTTFQNIENGEDWYHWMIGCDFHVRKIAKNVFDFAHGKSPKIFKDFLKLTVLSFSEFNFTCLFSELSHKNVSFNGKWLDKIFIFSKSGTINDFETESYIFYTGYLYFQLFSFLWFLILKKIKILSSDFPLKETFFWDNSENRQVKLNSEHDKTVNFRKSLKILGLFPCAKSKTFLAPFLMFLTVALKFLIDSKILHLLGIMSGNYQWLNHYVTDKWATVTINLASLYNRSQDNL